MINQNAHLSDSEIERLNNNQLEGVVLLNALEHIEYCQFCANRIPPPSQNETNKIFFDRFDAGKDRNKKTLIFDFSWSRGLIFIASTLLITFLIGYFFINNVSWKRNSTEIVLGNRVENRNQNSENSNSVIKNENNNSEIKQPDKVSEKPKKDVARLPKNLGKQKTPSTNRIHNSKTLPKQISPVFQEPNTNNAGAVRQHGKGNISNSRGVYTRTANCLELLVETKVINGQEQVKFYWKKNPRATKYHLYVSDNSQVLVEKFETEFESSYILKKQLDPSKSYKGKVAAMLKDGTTIFGETVFFKAGEKVGKNIPRRSNKKGSVRCLQ